MEIDARVDALKSRASPERADEIEIAAKRREAVSGVGFYGRGRPWGGWRAMAIRQIGRAGHSQIALREVHIFPVVLAVPSSQEVTLQFSGQTSLVRNGPPSHDGGVGSVFSYQFRRAVVARV